jgi:ribosomal protein L16 Arg81 hydroxylase
MSELISETQQTLIKLAELRTLLLRHSDDGNTPTGQDAAILQNKTNSLINDVVNGLSSIEQAGNLFTGQVDVETLQHLSDPSAPNPDIFLQSKLVEVLEIQKRAEGRKKMLLAVAAAIEVNEDEEKSV